MRRRRQNPKRAAVDRLEATFDRLAGRHNDTFDRRYRGRGPAVAPKILSVSRDRDIFRECVRQDFACLMAQKFATSAAFLEKLLPQSILGRAQNGHGWFMDSKGRPLIFADVTFDRVCSVLEGVYPHLNHWQVRAWRSQQIERLLKHLVKHFNEPFIALEDDQGPLFGIDFFRGRRVAREPFIKGLVLAGQMDDPDCRQRSLALLPFAFNDYELVLGYGGQEVVRPERLAQLNLGDTGARAFTAAERQRLIELEIMVEEKALYDYPEFDQAYFRRCTGDGVCDDLALLYVGRCHGFDALLGAFLSDAVDTYDKFLLQCCPGGMDGYLVEQLISLSYKTCGAPPVEEDELARMINFAAKLNQPNTRLSSSHRRLIQYEGGSDLPTLLQHWRFLNGERLPQIYLGFSREPAEKFYKTAFSRFQAAGLPVPMPRFTKK